MLTDRYLNGIPEGSRAGSDGRYLSGGQITPQLLDKVRALAPIAESRGQTIAQLALSWVLRGGRVTSAIIGASRVQQVLDAAAVGQAPDLTAEGISAIEQVLAG